MTFVAAKRFGKRIIMVGDTMISDLQGTRHSSIPGQLKIVVLSPTLTVAFAGLANQALDAIRTARRLHLAGETIAEIEQMLTEETAYHEGQIEFLLVSHSSGEPTLKRIWNGRSSNDLPYSCIGQRNLLPTLLMKAGEVPLGCPSHEFEQEVQFWTAFRRLFDGTRITDGVGGLPIMATCSPYGHCYNSSASSATWDVISFPGGLTQQQLTDRRSGMTQWLFNIQDTKYRGIAVLGILILDAGVGYIYSPLENDNPLNWSFSNPLTQAVRDTILAEFKAALEERAKSLGGLLIDNYTPIEHRLTDI